MIPTAIIGGSLLLIILLYSGRVILPITIYNALYMRLYWDSLYNTLYYSYMSLCKIAAKSIDLGVIEMISAHGPTRLVSFSKGQGPYNNK